MRSSTRSRARPPVSPSRWEPTSFAIFDVFDDESGRDAHLSGKVAEALLAQAEDLLATSPDIKKVDVVASKL